MPLLPLSSVAAQAVPSNASILINGDADLCDDEDGDGSVSNDDGITNCSEADGSFAHPYLIRARSVARLAPTGLETPTACPPGRGGTDCLVSCGAGNPFALVAICHTQRHIRVEKLDLASSYANDPSGSSSTPPTALLIRGSRNVTIAESSFSSVGPALLVGSDELVLSSVTVIGVSAAPPAVDAPNGPAVMAGSSQSVVLFENAGAVIERLVVAANNRRIGLEFRGSGRDHLPVLLDTVRISDADEVGMRLAAVNATARRVDLLNNGPAGFRDVEGAEGGNAATVSLEPRSVALQLVDSDLVLETGTVLHRGGGIDVDAGSMASVEGVRFRGGTPRAPVAIFREDNTRPCASLLSFNEFLNDSVVRNDDRCRIEVPNNWWGIGDVTQDRLEGHVNFIPPLSAPLDRLPVVVVAGPPAGDSVYDVVIVEGSAESRDGTRIVTVEITRVEGDWNQPYETREGSPWRMQVPVDGKPGDRFRLWVRACSEMTCGIPKRLSLIVGQVPRAPIAILEATPRVGSPEQIIRFDANASYSPIGLRIVEYSFDLGDGTLAGPLTKSSQDHRYRLPGLYRVTLTVADEAGVQSASVSSVTVNIRDPDAAQNLQRDPLASLPGVGPAGALALLFAPAAFRRWRS